MTDLLGLDTEQLRELAEAQGERPFRGQQLATWLYRKHVTDLEAMSDLPRAWRDQLIAAGHQGGSLRQARVQASSDGTCKYLFATRLGGMIESVLMPSDDRVSVCVSTQIGCAVGCAFCETGISGFQRDLSAGEIVEQVGAIAAHSGRRISHVVFMGMGEPLLNLEATLKAIRLLNREGGIAMRQLTVSTSGVIPGIHQLAEAKLQLTLAISLHAPNDALRDRLVPLNRRYPLAELHRAAADYVARTGRRLTVEYVMLRDVNDSVELARQTASWLKGLHAHVNLIPFNATDAAFGPSRPDAVARFRAILEEAGFPVTVRVERGADIAAACGQLRRQALGEGGEVVPQVKLGMARGSDA